MERSIEGVGGSFRRESFRDIPLEVPTPVPEYVSIRAGRVARVLAVITLLLVILSLVTGATGVADQIFALDAERNVPTYFSTVILFIAAALLALVATLKRRRGDPFRRHWAALSLVFVYLSMDELISFHEMTSARIERVVHTGGPFYYASTLFTSSLVLLFTIAFFRFLLHLPRESAVLFVASAVLYVGGGLGMEMVGALVDQAYGTSSEFYTLSSTIEETLEMYGVVLFIYSLLHYLSVHLHEPRVRISREA